MDLGKAGFFQGGMMERMRKMGAAGWGFRTCPGGNCLEGRFSEDAEGPNMHDVEAGRSSCSEHSQRW